LISNYDTRKIGTSSRTPKQLYIYDLEMKSSRRLTTEEGIYASGISSSDGKWIAYMSIASGKVDVRAVQVEGGESRAVVTTPRQDFHPPLLSPVGTWIYFGK
jgi:Tol biopolymer transport system component